MNYYLAKTIDKPFDECVAKVTGELKKEGFGILTDIDVRETLKNKLGVDFRQYRILGACNPPYAHQALTVEDKIGVLLPCNVIVQETADGKVEVAAVNPESSMQAVGNEALKGIASRIRGKLESVIGRL